MIKTFQVRCPKCRKVLDIIVKVEEYEDIKKEAGLDEYKQERRIQCSGAV